MLNLECLLTKRIVDQVDHQCTDDILAMIVINTLVMSMLYRQKGIDFMGSKQTTGVQAKHIVCRYSAIMHEQVLQETHQCLVSIIWVVVKLMKK